MKWFYRIAPLTVLLLILVFSIHLEGNAGKTMRLELDENDSSVCLEIPKGKKIKGWEKDGVTYFFVPSYVETEQLVFEGSRNCFVDKDNQVRYDEIQKLFLCDEQGTVLDSKYICFKHSTNLYTMYMELAGGGNFSITKDDFVQADISIVDLEGNVTYDKKGNQIRGHGNSTWRLDKKPYYIKLPEKEALCGMEPGKKWFLLASGYEGTKILNKMFYDFASEIGLDYCSESEWVDLYINGEYYGNYLLCEKIDIGQNSVNIADLQKENEIVYGDECGQYADDYIRGFLTDVNPHNITGGYIIEKDIPAYWRNEACGFQTGNGSYFTIKAPDNASVKEVEYICGIFENIENLLEQGSGEVLQYIDKESFVKRFLLEEIVLNSDAYITSCYFYKRRNDEKIYAGPVWDYDGTVGESNNVWLEYDRTTVFDMNRNRGDNIALEWDAGLYEIEEYRDFMEETYDEILPNLQELRDTGIDGYVEKVRKSVEMDSIRWDYGLDTAGHYSSFDNNVRYIKFFLSQRINFLNKRFGKAETPYDNADGSEHKIVCMDEDNVISWSVKDGDFLKDGDLPEFDERIYCGWVYERDGLPVSEYLPVYEDLVLKLEKRETMTE